MNGLIAVLILNYSLFPVSGDVTALVGAGYHLGPAYAMVSVETHAEEQDLAWAYSPDRVLYDFRVGARFGDVDFGLSRWCYHNVSLGKYSQPWGLSFYFEWSTW